MNDLFGEVPAPTTAEQIATLAKLKGQQPTQQPPDVGLWDMQTDLLDAIAKTK